MGISKIISRELYVSNKPIYCILFITAYMIQESSKIVPVLKKIFVVGCLLYATISHFLVAIILKNEGYSVGFAVIAMALTLIVTWAVLGGLL